MDLSTLPTYHYKSIADLTELPETPAFLELQIYNDLFSCLYIPQPQYKIKKTYVFLNGAFTAEEVEKPIFQRWSWFKEFDGNCLYIFDPMIYHNTEIVLAWYAGRENYNYAVVLKSITQRVAETNETQPENITFYGSSGGGFAAIATAARFQNTKAIAINPQIKLVDYSRKLVRKYSDFAFPNSTYAKFISDYPMHNNTCAMIDKMQPSLRVLIYQNILDYSHFGRHMTEFARHFSIKPTGGVSADNTKKIILYEDERGHVGETKGDVKRLLHEAASLSRC